MAYVYFHLLKGQPKHLHEFYKFYKTFKKYTDLEHTFEILNTQRQDHFKKEALAKAYKVKISNNFNQLTEINVNVDSRFDSKIISEILTNLKEKCNKKLTDEQKDKLFKIYKVQEALVFLLSQGYDIKIFINKNADEIVNMLKSSKNESGDPLWDRKKNEFLKYYNQLSKTVKRGNVLCNLNSLPHIEYASSNPGEMVYIIRRNYVIKAPIGMPEKKTLNDYVDLRIQGEKIKEMVRIYLAKEYADEKFKNNDLIDEEWEQQVEKKAIAILANLSLADRHKFLELYETIPKHSDHHLNFINALNDQKISLEEEQDMSKNKTMELEKVPEIVEPSFETKTQQRLLHELEEGSDYDSDKSVASNDDNMIILTPDHEQMLTIDNKSYSSISCYVYAQLLQAVTNDTSSYFDIFLNSKQAVKNEKYRHKLENFKKLEDIDALITQKFNERKVFLAKKILNALFLESDNWSIVEKLKNTGNAPIYVFMTDPILGVDAQGQGANKIGLILQDLRDVLSNVPNKSRDKFMDSIYRCSSDPQMQEWLESRYTDVIQTVKIFAKFFSIIPVSSECVTYVINTFYLPNLSIYGACNDVLSTIPPKIFIMSVHKDFGNIKYEPKVISLLWKFTSCLCCNLIRANDGGDISQTIKNYHGRLDYRENKSKKLRLEALENVACHFKNYNALVPIDYYTPSAQIIAGSLKPPKINLKFKNEKEAMVDYLTNVSTNRLNFFAKNKCRIK